MKSRTDYAVKNIKWGIISKVSTVLLAFITRTVFIYCLGKQFLGINGLYTEILGMLSLAELGFGAAMTYSMYAPVAANDQERIVQLLRLYKKIYTVVAIVIAALGIGLLPVLQYIVKGADKLSVFELRLYFLIYLINTVSGYFVTYKYSYLNAKMKNYVTLNLDMLVTIVSNILQIFVLILTNSFLVYLITNSAVLVLSRVCISIYLNRTNSVFTVEEHSTLPKEEKDKLYNEVRSLAIHQFASVAVHSTDSIIISSFSGLGVVAVGLISNYNMLINSVVSFVSIVFNSVSSGFGNLYASSSKESFRKAFLEMNFLNFWLYGFCTIAFWVLIPPFICLWIGKSFLIDEGSFSLILINCYLQGQCTAYHNARVAAGNFDKDKWMSVVQAIVNLIVSILCAMKFGLVGVFIGTVVSRVVYIVLRPRATYYFLFNQSATEYYKYLLKYFIVVLLTGIVTKTITNYVLVNVTIGTFVLSCMIVAIIPNIAFFLVMHRTMEYEMVALRVKSIMKRKGMIHE